MARATAAPTASSIARGNSVHSSLGTMAPLNTPTRRFYGINDELAIREPGVPNPNIYVVQPFKNASVPKDFVYAKKNAPNPGESLLNSTIELINHFSSCYEAVKHQLQNEQTKERENALISTSMTIGGTVNTNSRNTLNKPAKQAKLRPLILHQNQQFRENNQGPSIEDCIGISPVPVTKADDLAGIYDERLRVLRKLKPEFFDKQGNLISHAPRSNSYDQPSPKSSKKSATTSFRTPYNTMTAENIPFDDRRTFLTEFTNEDEDNEGEQTNAMNEYVKNNYVLKVLDIKTMTTTSAKRDRNKSASEKGTVHSRKGNQTIKST